MLFRSSDYFPNPAISVQFFRIFDNLFKSGLIFFIPDNKMIAFSVMCCTCVAIVMFVMAPLFPMLYNTNDEARELAKYLIMITAFFMPQNAFLHATYFTLRSGGKTIITFLFDSVFIWCVSVPIAFVLSRYTGIHVLVIYACVQLADLIKCVIGFVLVKKGVWLQNIVSS